MLDLPQMVDAETIGEFDLIERVVEEFFFRTFQPGARQIGEGAGEQDHQALDRHHHVASDGGNVETEFGAALLQHPKQQHPGKEARQVSLFPVLPSVTWNFKF